MTPTITAAEYRRTKAPRRPKFGNVKTVVDGITFASKLEAKRYGELKLMLRSGDIDTLELQPRLDLHFNGVKICTYVADFRYRERPSLLVVVEDVKGKETREFKNKWKHAQQEYKFWSFRLYPPKRAA